MNKIFERFYSYISASTWGFLSVIVGLLGDILAILSFPGYNLNYMISDLALTPGGIFFDAGTILSGVFALFLYIDLWRYLDSKTKDPIILKIGNISAITSCCFFILIGIFPSNKAIPFLFVTHGTVALISWITAIAYLSCYTFIFIKMKEFRASYRYSGIVLIVLLLIFLFTWIPFWEWAMTLAVIYWILMTSIELKKHENKINVN